FEMDQSRKNPAPTRFTRVPLRRIVGWLVVVLAIWCAPRAEAQGGPPGGAVFSLAIDPSTPATLYAGLMGGEVFKTTDGAATWYKTGTEIQAEWVFRLAINPSTPSTLYAGTDRGLYRTVNGGISWLKVATAISNGYVYTIAIDPSTPSTVYAGGMNGVFKSTD